MSYTSPWPTIITIYGLRTLPTPQPSKNGSGSSATDVNGIDVSKAWQSGGDALGSARANRLCSSVLLLVTVGNHKKWDTFVKERSRGCASVAGLSVPPVVASDLQ